MRWLCLFAPLFLWLSATHLAAQTAQPRSAEIIPYQHFDANGIFLDLSGDGTIWPALPHQHALLRVQLVPEGGERITPQPGNIVRRQGIPATQIHVDAQPDIVEFSPTFDQGGWLTDEHGIFEITVQVPEETGDHRFIFRTEDPAVAPLITTIKVRSANWVLWLVLGLIGGLAIFLHGMGIASQGLKDGAGNRLRDGLQRLTDKPSRGLLTGGAVTVLTQSSSATTVMLVGFVRSGLITLRQSFGPIFGAAIGTTLTVQLLAFRIQDYALSMIAVGGLLMFFGARRPRATAGGKVVFGFGLIFFGMAVMTDVIEPLKTSPAFVEMITRLTSRPILCTVVATVFTAIVQSSGATLGIAITLANAGLLSIDEALPIIFGANIGTCATALLASVGGSSDGKRVALAHLIFKVGGVLVFLPWFMSGPSGVVLGRLLRLHGRLVQRCRSS